ncbi:MAG: 5-(carboxyamino)imidazole ribonucleotide mutase [Victivallaceae bacterium]|nr:5-(carboxyamino)imidazole ribonucleotide mutase [Victivallaceae bacterium]
MTEKPVIAVLMGSRSDLPAVENTFKILRDFGVSFEARIMSAHRTPEDVREFAEDAEADGFKVIICVAGMAAHLAGVVAAHTVLPVIGWPMVSEPFNGMDALLATVQMPPGVPVAAVTAGKAGAKNAALYALSILALGDAGLAQRLKEFRRGQAAEVKQADGELQHYLKAANSAR